MSVRVCVYVCVCVCENGTWETHWLLCNRTNVIFLQKELSYNDMVGRGSLAETETGLLILRGALGSLNFKEQGVCDRWVWLMNESATDFFLKHGCCRDDCVRSMIGQEDQRFMKRNVLV